MAGYRELAVWQRAMDLTIEVYAVTNKYPQAERFGLVSQTQRSAVSIAANIAEGRGRGTTREFHRFVGIALGSLAELETQLLIATRLTYITETESNRLLRDAAQLARMLGGLKSSLKRKLGDSDKKP
jgi:four helix bundle protein